MFQLNIAYIKHQMKRRKQMNNIKKKTNEFMKNNGRFAYLITISFALINGIMSGITGEMVFMDLIWTLISLVISVIISISFLVMVRESDSTKNEKTEIIKEDTKKNWMKYAILAIVRDIYLFLWSLLFIIPGLVKSYAYIFAPYIQYDNNQMSSGDVLQKSIEMTNGRKGKIFSLNISYYANAFVTFAIALLLTVAAIDQLKGTLFIVLAILASIAFAAFFILLFIAAPRWQAALVFLYEEWNDEVKENDTTTNSFETKEEVAEEISEETVAKSETDEEKQ